jgi:hypothetical protein
MLRGRGLLVRAGCLKVSLAKYIFCAIIYPLLPNYWKKAAERPGMSAARGRRPPRRPNRRNEVSVMTKRYLVKIKGEFQETQAVVAENENEAKKLSQNEK